MNTEEKLKIAIEALQKLVKPVGAYSRDALTHCENVLTEVTEIAKEALSKINE